MTEKTFETASGTIRYWTNEICPKRKTLVFLPGLTADHHLFDKQIEAFEKEYNLFTWDAPGHAASRPFRLDFSLMDKATWLHEILKKDGSRISVLCMGKKYYDSALKAYRSEILITPARNE